MKRRFWTTREVAVLRELYPAQGMAACEAALPHRGTRAIYHKANELGLSREGRKAGRAGPYTSNDFIDAAIRRLYQSPPAPAAVQALAKQVDRPRWWIGRRAVKLGVAMPRFKEPPWSEAELELLGNHVGMQPESLRNLFLRRGFRRSAAAIEVKRKRMGWYLRDREEVSAHGLARIMGVDATTVTNWIHKGLLRAKRRKTARTEVQGGDPWEITPKAVREFLITHTAAWDHRKCDKFWLVDILSGSTGIKGDAMKEVAS